MQPVDAWCLPRLSRTMLGAVAAAALLTAWAGTASAQAPESPGTARTSPGDPGAVKPSAEPVLYTAAWCTYCAQARAYLARAGIRYRELDVDSPEGKTAFAAAGGGGVPLLVVEDDQLRGYTELAYDYFFARHR